MPVGRVRLQLWCEDRHQEQFLRAFFSSPKYGLSRRDLTFHVAPSGIGSGAQWVAANFHRAIQLARAEKHQQRLGVLVMIDGDTDGVHARKSTLLTQSNRDRETLKLAIWVPTRNIETWVKFLAELPPAASPSEWEELDFKQEVGRRWDHALLAKAIARWQAVGEPALSSLQDAHQELQRLPFE